MLVQIAPGNAGPRDPENPIQNKSMIPRTPPAARTALDHERLKTRPFLVAHQTPDQDGLPKSHLESDTAPLGNPLCQHVLTFTDDNRRDLVKVEWNDKDFTSIVKWWFSEEDTTTNRETEKYASVKVRTMQGVFKRRVLMFEKQCRLTLIRDEKFLIASHIKPWSESDPKQQLDGNNGLMLARHADHLFDRHFISFEDDGTVLKSKALPDEVWRALGFENVTNVGKFNPRQAEYMKLHRKAFYEKQ